MSIQTSLFTKSAAAFAVVALGVTACSPDDAEFEENDDAAETAGTEDEAQDNGETDSDDAGTEAQDGEGEPTTAEEPEADEAEAAEDEVRAVAEFLAEEYPDGEIGEIEDEGGYFEVEIFDLGSGTEYEFDIDPETFEMWDYDEETLDSDDQQKAEAVEISFLDALDTAEGEAGEDPTFDEAELDTEDGVVVWEIEFVNDVEVYVDVASGDVVKVD
ncbi:PepSY domain-containing protein [Nesterenkonia populi]|uniref:PepSY domain-containing protein n=1 Tax=Nesterenkonia populi TaxID=1591087 RepID=UPI001B864667|nr:PepSY domain-containing protein [Nesterenkonia populi]